MKLFTSLLLTAALTAGFAAAPASAGPFDIVKSKAKSEAKKEARKQAKEKAAEELIKATGASESTASTAVDGGEKALEFTGVIDKAPKKDTSLLGKAVDAAKGSMTSKDEAEDDVVEAAKDTAYEHMAGDADHKHDAAHEMKDAAEEAVEAAVEKPAAPVLPPVNCPEGTTAQADGTCMITGDYGL